MPPEPPLSAIVTDLDGTLLTSDKRVSARSVAALTAAHARGVLLAAASARPKRLIDAAISGVLHLFDAVVVSNGAAVIAAEGTQVLAAELITAPEAVHAMALIRRAWPGAGFGWESGGDFRGDVRFHRLARTQRILRDTSDPPVLDRPDRAIHQLVAAVARTRPIELLAEARTLLGPGFTITDSDGGVLEVAHANATKAHGVRAWAGHRGISMDHVVAFGDETNDLELLTAAGHGVAMGNARQSVKDAADEVADVNDRDGLAQVLERLLAERELSMIRTT